MDKAPNGQGWQLKEDQLEIYWTDQAPAPDAVMKLVCAVAAKDHVLHDAALALAMVFVAQRHVHVRTAV